MEPAQLLLLALLWGAIFGAVFCLATLAAGRVNAAMLLNDYPPDVQARFGQMDPATRRQARAAGWLLLALLAAVLAAGLAHLRAQGASGWLETFLFLLAVLQVWNLIDLLVLDWLLLVTLRPKFMILPGTEGLPGYRDYRFHLQKFLKGIALTALLAAVLTPLVMGISFLLSWLAGGGLQGFAAWTWARHHNILSWYIRPLFLLPFCYFAFRRSLAGMLLTVVALATSMFWFPAPLQPDARVLEFLAFEQQWLTGPWGVEKLMLSLTVPLAFFLLGLAFWQRSLWYGMGIITLIALGKSLWSVLAGGESGWAVLPPALIGLALCNLAVFTAYRGLARRKRLGTR